MHSDAPRLKASIPKDPVPSAVPRSFFHISIQKMCGLVVVGFTISRIYCTYIYMHYIYYINQALSSKKKTAKKGFSNWKFGHTVDASEIQRSPVEVDSCSPLFTKVLYKTPVMIAGFLNHQQYLRIIDQSELPTSSTHNSDGLKNHVMEPPFAACEEIQHSNGTIFEQVHGGHLKKVGQKSICWGRGSTQSPKNWWLVKK